MNASNVGALEILFSQGRGDQVEIRFDNEERRFVATLWEDVDPDEDDDLEDDIDDDDDGVSEGDESLSPAAYELVEYGEEDDEPPVLRELVSASGETMVEALLQLELAYRNLLGYEKGSR